MNTQLQLKTTLVSCVVLLLWGLYCYYLWMRNTILLYDSTLIIHINLGSVLFFKQFGQWSNSLGSIVTNPNETISIFHIRYTISVQEKIASLLVTNLT